ncbi:hypothetical protein N7539_004126 [Penicillium diatomitis]|uniref:Uncharacterized protein n=1 Tax=Penicillium diatomitis TaxID=2819901 RepID=A0A9X0BXW6_9EURO|nr:uncharacterized protein N7539_004126 [Penicillium diatomitis]KAJ5489236.1 hypothetical protein N7539_004126 [Penicillium diatomitis]
MRKNPPSSRSGEHERQGGNCGTERGHKRKDVNASRLRIPKSRGTTGDALLLRSPANFDEPTKLTAKAYLAVNGRGNPRADCGSPRGDEFPLLIFYFISVLSAEDRLVLV